MNNEKDKDIQEYIDFSLDFVDRMLIEHGEFFPFAGQIDILGKFTSIGYYEGNDKPLSQKLIDSFTKNLDTELVSGKIRSYAITFDVKIKNKNFPEGIDAIVVSIKHVSENTILKYFFPYIIVKTGEIKYFEGWLDNS